MWWKSGLSPDVKIALSDANLEKLLDLKTSDEIIFKSLHVLFIFEIFCFILIYLAI